MDDQVLKAESVALHRAIFGRDPSDEMSRRYVEAHRHALTRVTDAEREWMAKALGSDLEALEISVRNPRADHILTRKMKVLVYLAEASPEYFDRFVNEKPRRLAAFFTLGWHGARTVAKRMKGWLIRKARGL